MIRNLGYQIICEGVETDEQILKIQIGCDEIQDILFETIVDGRLQELFQSEKFQGGKCNPNRQKVLRYTLGNENLKERKIQ